MFLHLIPHISGLCLPFEFEASVLLPARDLQSPLRQALRQIRLERTPLTGYNSQPDLSD